MKNVDYIIVGGGYAGLFFAHQLRQHQKSFVIFADRENSASEVSAGMVNPAVLKKFTTFWLAQEEINELHHTLSEMQQYLGQNYFIPEEVHRIFHDETEKQLWLKKSSDENLKPFLSRDFRKLEVVVNPFESGTVMQSGRLNVQAFFKDFYNYLEQEGLLRQESFVYEHLDPETKIYKDLAFQKILFCEGCRVVENPWFKDIPIQPNKGHHLLVELEKPLTDKVAVKKKHFLFPVSGNLYYYGGTYDRINVDPYIDEEAVQQLENGLKEFYPFSYRIVDVEVGFRPTVKDRRPILGNSAVYPDFYVFNGLGARGVLNGCYFSKMLYNHIENKQPLYPEVTLKRFEKKAEEE